MHRLLPREGPSLTLLTAPHSSGRLLQLAWVWRLLLHGLSAFLEEQAKEMRRQGAAATTEGVEWGGGCWNLMKCRLTEMQM